MPNKNLLLTDDDVEKIGQVLAKHPELKTFTATVRWMIQTYQDPGEEKESAKSIALLGQLQKKLMAMSKEQSIQTQMLVGLLTEFKVPVAGNVLANPKFIEAQMEANKRLNQAMAERNKQV